MALNARELADQADTLVNNIYSEAIQMLQRESDELLHALFDDRSDVLERINALTERENVAIHSDDSDY